MSARDIAVDTRVAPNRKSEPDGVGREAISPLSIPWAGWLNVASRVVDEISQDRASMVAASVAFYATLALFPALIATFSLYALWEDPATLAHQVRDLTVAIPWSARSLILSEVTEISASSSRLSVGLAISLCVSFFAASSGIAALIDAVNLAYDEKETRGFLVLRWLAFRFTVGISLFVCVAMTSLTVLPTISEYFGARGAVEWLVRIGRWPALALWVMAGLSVLYRYAPNRTPPKFRWVTPGAALATLIWLGASVGLSIYAQNFGHYNKTYGTIGAVIVLLLWFFVSSFAIVLGAEVNAELEHQTSVDTTVGPPAPMGQRGAVMADSLGESTPSRPLRQILKSAFESAKAPKRDKRRPG